MSKVSKVSEVFNVPSAQLALHSSIRHLLSHLPYRVFSVDVIASDRRERRNRTIGAIQRLCDYDVAIAPRNDNTFPRHCEEGKHSVARRGNPYKNVVCKLGFQPNKKMKGQ